MMTQTHSLVAVALLAGPERSSRQNLAVLIGSLIPDTAIFGLFFWSKFNGIPESDVWQRIYFSEPMLTLTAIGNSLPLYASVLFFTMFIAVFRGKPSTHENQQFVLPALALFSLAAITHLIGDFPVHASDAHAHFWPVSDWRFESPISYWDRSHHGRLFSLFEAAVGVILGAIVFQRFKQTLIRVLVGVAILSYIAVPVYFSSAL